jgi:hypothetical protein
VGPRRDGSRPINNMMCSNNIVAFGYHYYRCTIIEHARVKFCAGKKLCRKSRTIFVALAFVVSFVTLLFSCARYRSAITDDASKVDREPNRPHSTRIVLIRSISLPRKTVFRAYNANGNAHVLVRVQSTDGIQNYSNWFSTERDYVKRKKNNFKNYTLDVHKNHHHSVRACVFCSP